MIDTSKPMQLSDGTPVTLHRLGSPPYGDEIWVNTPTNMHRDRTAPFVFSTSGERPPYFGIFDGLTLQNVPEAPALDLTKPVQTRDGRPARVIATDRKATRSLVVLIDDGSGVERAVTRHADGRYSQHRDGNGDLVNVPETTYLFVNVYPNGPWGDNRPAAFALRSSDDKPMANGHQVKLTYENGKPVAAELV